MTKNDSVKIYRLRVWLKGVSPMIWRRLLVRSDNTIANLHHTLQIVMNWEDYYLHQFIIQGKTLNDGRGICLEEFQFRENEKFLYEYNFFVFWSHEIRVEKILPFDSKIVHPICIAGKRTAPPEDCGGSNAFMELQDHYSSWRIMEKLEHLVKLARRRSNKVPHDDDCNEDYDEDYDYDDNEDDDNPETTLETLEYWANQHRFNRRAINQQLQEHFKSINNAENVSEVINEN